MISRLRKSTFLKSALVLISGTTLAQVVPIAVMPFIGRMFSPEDFGVLGLFTAFVAVASVTVSLSFHYAIVSDISDRTAAQLAILGFIPILPIALITVGVLLVLRNAQALGFHELSLIDVLFACFSLVAIGFFGVLRYWLVRRDAFGVVGRATVSQSVGRVVAQVATGMAGMGGTGLTLAEVIGRSSGVTMLARNAVADIKDLSSGTGATEYKKLAIEYRKFPLVNMPSALINALGTALLIPLVAGTYGVSLSGQFSMGYRVLTLPIAVIASAVADVFHSQVVKAAKVSMAQARRLYLVVTASLFLIGLIPSLIIMAFGPRIFTFVLGDQWETAGMIAAGLMPWLLASFTVSPGSRVVMVFRGQEMKLIYDVLNIVGVVGVIQLGNANDWSVVRTAQTLGVTQAFAYVVYFFLLWRILSTHNSSNAAT